MLFASVVAYIDLKPPESYETNQIRYIYNQAEVNAKESQMSTDQKLVVYVGLPALVGVLVLFLAWKFCVRKIYMADTRLVEDDEQKKGAQPLDTEVVTSKVVADTGMMSTANMISVVEAAEGDGH